MSEGEPAGAVAQQLVDEWQRRLERCPGRVRARVRELAEQHRAMLAERFYAEMLADPDACVFLDHEDVNSRLDASLQEWIRGIFSVESGSGVEEQAARQAHVGDIHARISIPIHLVMRGARCVKEQLLTLLDRDSAMGHEMRLQAARHVSDSIDMAMELMSHAYSRSHERNARAEEAYRLFAVSENLASEKDRQRACLLDWENGLMFDLAMGASGEQLPRLAASEFGLWFRHKGVDAFGGAAETERVLEAIARIDEFLLPSLVCVEARQRQDYLRDVREQVRSIDYHLGQLFERSNELESGRDVLTRTLNRKFLPVVLGRHIASVQQTHAPFAVLALDIDYFKRVNDEHGHETGDRILQQFATLLVSNSRAGDYLFRLGGEEFLMMLVDVVPRDAERIAEKLRTAVRAEPFQGAHGEQLGLTVSIGLASHDGHPDYQRLVRRADDALYAAKNAGRDRVATAD
nr:diguanylate cyclase [Thioalkalivibrio sp. ALgr3]